ncbi:MAG: hypothetical protein CMH30_09345 [Micavibrio sp.]|nr:hypothetical protein [Micavibrio sp.]|tara:strand:- start:1383 stop:2603 length:1221 start_codon:yes stop_codon:yes gene_type:complete
MKKDIQNTILNTYKPMGRKIGTETEHLIADAIGRPLSVRATEEFAQMLFKEKIDHSREIFAGVFETKTDAYEPGDLKLLFAENAESNQRMQTVANNLGYILYALPFFPALTLQDALALRIRHPRADGLLRHLQKLNKERIVEHCVMTTGIHVSLGFETLDEALEICQLASMLIPILTMLTENSSHQSKHMMAYRRHGQGKRTDIQDYFFAAQNGQELINKHVEHIKSVPAMMFMDATGEAQVFENPDRESFSMLPEALQTADNFFMIEKMQYNDVKLAAIKDKQGDVMGHRVEIRMADRGTYQHDFMVFVALILSDVCGRKMLENFLLAYGYDRGAINIVDMLHKDLEIAINHNGQRFKNTTAQGYAFRDMAKSLLCVMTQFMDLHYGQYQGEALKVFKQPRRLLL